MKKLKLLMVKKIIPPPIKKRKGVNCGHPENTKSGQYSSDARETRKRRRYTLLDDDVSVSGDQ